MTSAGDMSVMTPRMKTNKDTFDMASFRESLALAEIQARSAARKEDKQNNVARRPPTRKRSQSTSNADQNYVPPKQLLMYLVR